MPDPGSAAVYLGNRPSIKQPTRASGAVQVKPQFSAPGRIRTRDPLLRRQLLCPAELRAPGNKCALRMSHDGYTKVAVSSPEPVCSSLEVKSPAANSLAAREYLNLPSSL